LTRAGFSLIAAALLTLGCTDVRVKDVLKEFDGAPYEKSVETDNHKLAIRYIPRTYQILRRSGLDTSALVDTRLLDSLEAEYGKVGTVFTLLLQPRNGDQDAGLENDVVYGSLSGFSSYQATMRAYAFGLHEKNRMEVKGKKIPLSRYQMDNSFGLTKGRNFILLFPALPQEAKAEEVRLVLDDIVPGLARKKLVWSFPVGKYDESI
jgi:hypothetical protein